MVTLDCSLFHLNVKNTFLYNDLYGKVYIEQPLGFVPYGESYIVYMYKKVIYGLK